MKNSDSETSLGALCGNSQFGLSRLIHAVLGSAVLLAATFSGAKAQAINEDGGIRTMDPVTSYGFVRDWLYGNHGPGGSWGSTGYMQEYWDEEDSLEEAFRPNDFCDPAEVSGNPIVTKSGGKIEQDIDFTTTGEMPLELVRYYSQIESSGGVFGAGWYSNLDNVLSFPHCEGILSIPGNCWVDPNLLSVTVVLGQGRRELYIKNATTGIYEHSSGKTFKWLERAADYSFTMRRKDGASMHFRPDGLVDSIVSPTGVAWNYTFTTNKITVTHSNGRSIVLNVDPGHKRVTSVVDPAGKTYTYGYAFDAGFPGVTQVTFPGGGADGITYHYSPAYPNQHRLEGKSIGGQRFSTFLFGSSGRASESYHHLGASKIERTQLSYGYETVDGVNLSYTDVTNANNYVVRYSYKNTGNDLKIARVSRQGSVNCPAAASRVYYDSNGHVDYELDFNGVKTDYSYNADGQLLERREGIDGVALLGRRIYTYTWDTKNRITHELVKDVEINFVADTPRSVASTTWEYYPDGVVAKNRLKSVTRSSLIGRTANETTQFTYTFHPNGLVSQMRVDGPVAGTGDRGTINYKSTGEVSSFANSLGHTSTYQTNAWGRVTQSIDPNGDQVDTTYDDRGRIKTVTRYLGPSLTARTTTYTYDRFGNIQSVQEPNGVYSTYTYDQANRLERIERTHNASLKARTRYAYNLLSLPISAIVDTISTSGVVGAERFRETRSYDDIGRLLAVTDGMNRVTRFVYDSEGNIVKQTDPLLRDTLYEYDSLKRITKITDRALGVTVHQYGIDSAQISNLKLFHRVTPPTGGATQTNFDGFGNVLMLASPDAGTSTFAYDAGGRLASTTRADAQVVIRAYDSLNRISSVTTPWPAGGASAAGWMTSSQTYAYDTCANGKGRLCSATNYSGTTSYAYTKEGNLDLLTEDLSGYPLALDYTYDSFARPTGVIHPDGTRVVKSYLYDKVTGVSAIIGGITKSVVSSISYEPYGAISGYTYANGFVRTVGRNLSGATSSISVPGVQALTFGFDGIGNINNISNGQDAAATQSYTYDNLERLKTSNRTGNNEVWTYDGIGNRKTHTNGTAYTLNYSGNKLASISPLARTYQNDLLGNRVGEIRGGSTVTYIYDGTMRLRYFARDVASSLCEPTGQCLAGPKGTWEYGYNHAGLRTYKMTLDYPVTTTLGVKRYLYSPSGELQAETISGSSAAVSTVGSHYIWFGGEPVGIVRSSQLYFVHNDQLGRPEAVTNTSGVLSWRARNNAFTRDIVSGSTFGEMNLGLPGQYFDAETALYYNWHRHYDPATGRYTQSDPVGLQGGAGTFAYATGNPVNVFDRSGLLYEFQYDFKYDDMMSEVEIHPCESSAWANGVAQATPLLGLGLALTGTNVTVTDWGGIDLVHSPATAYDYLSGGGEAAAIMIGSPAGAAFANMYQMSQYRDLNNGNKASRRGALQANRSIWGGASAGAGVVAKGFGVLGAVAAGAGVWEDLQKCGCKE